MIIVISGATGSGVETFTKLLAAAFDLPAYRGDDMGHWDVDKIYDRWVYRTDDLDLRRFVLTEGAKGVSSCSMLTSEITGFISLTDGADQDVVGRLVSANDALPIVVIRYYVDQPRVFVRRVQSWRSAHKLPSLRSHLDTDIDLCSKLGCVLDAEYARIEDCRVASQNNVWTLVPCSQTFSELERVIGGILAFDERERSLPDAKGRSLDGAKLLSSSRRSEALHVWHALNTLSSAKIRLDAPDLSGDLMTRFDLYMRGIAHGYAGDSDVSVKCFNALGLLRDFVYKALHHTKLHRLSHCAS